MKCSKVLMFLLVGVGLISCTPEDPIVEVPCDICSPIENSEIFSDTVYMSLSTTGWMIRPYEDYDDLKALSICNEEFLHEQFNGRLARVKYRDVIRCDSIFERKPVVIDDLEVIEYCEKEFSTIDSPDLLYKYWYIHEVHTDTTLNPPCELDANNFSMRIDSVMQGGSSMFQAGASAIVGSNTYVYSGIFNSADSTFQINESVRTTASNRSASVRFFEKNVNSVLWNNDASIATLSIIDSVLILTNSGSGYQLKLIAYDRY